MTCGEAMEKQFDVCVAHERLLDALEILAATDDDRVPVVVDRESMRFEGEITAKSAAIHLGLTDRRPSEVMCREVVAAATAMVAPEDDVTRAAATMRQYGLRRLPVVEAGKLVGLLSTSHLGPA